MIHEVLPVGMLRCNCSIVGDEATREAIVIDPGDEIGRIQEILNRHQLKVTAIVITHAHIDHVAGAALLRKATGAPVYMNSSDIELLNALEMQAQWLGLQQTPEQTAVDGDAKDGSTLKLGSRELQILHTPGHTQGSLCVFIPAERLLFAGDTLFQGSVGRTDLPGGDHRQLLRSIHDKILVLPEETLVIPGHGQATTIGEERDTNPFLQS